MPIDILTQPNPQSGQFTTNIAAPSGMVQITQAGTGILFNGQYNYRFSSKDNFNILSIGYKLPYSFEIAEHVSMLWGISHVIPISIFICSFPSNTEIELIPRSVLIPFDNFELNYGSFFDLSSYLIPPADTEFEIRARFYPNSFVSMLNVPTALDAKDFRVQIFAKIQHNLEMV
jgi:hypothetical protein